MGWSSGSELGTGLWVEIRENIRPDKLEETARAFIDSLEDMDCDTVGECEQLVIDAGLEAEYWPEEDE